MGKIEAIEQVQLFSMDGFVAHKAFFKVEEVNTYAGN